MSLNTVDILIGRLISLLENEASSLVGVHEEIKDMKRQLKSLCCFLMDAERGRANSETHKDWVRNIREIAYEVEDTIDQFTYHVNKQRQWRGNNCGSFFQRSLHFPAHLLVRRKVTAKLQNINKRMERIEKTAHQLGVQQEEEKGSSYDLDSINIWSELSRFFKEDDLVINKKAQNELLGWLMDEKRPRAVIAVVGMGGLGKTTLVANTYNKQYVEQHFDFCTWIRVLEKPVVELLRSIAKEVEKQTNEEVPMKGDSMSYKLVETLVQYLKPRRYLIVLDDVWDIEVLKAISILLPEGLPGSALMVTTRNEDVAQNRFVTHAHHLQPLKEEDAWKLFCSRAFPKELGGSYPSYLSSLARTLAEKCEGLPLAIVLLGSLMSSKKSTAEWKSVLDNLNWELSNNPALDRVKIIPLLSYYGLPLQLKHCFLYCCIFPENYVIGRKRLTRLWMAEGFLQQTDGVPPEEIAQRYLMKLIDRSLLQVIERDAFGRPKAVKMHTILRELALSIAKDENFITVSDGEKGLDGIRRCSIEVKSEEMKLGNDGTSVSHSIRSLLIFGAINISKSSSFKLPSDFKLLRVLDLECAPIDKLPRKFGSLFNLRYLNLNKTQVKVLPKWIGKLSNLQTLLLKYTQIRELPHEIVKLQKLRHLIASYYGSESDELEVLNTWCIRVPSNICRIKSLQVLCDVEVTGTVVKQLKGMTQLRRLSLDLTEEADEKDLCLAIQNMVNLQYLALGVAYDVAIAIKLDALKSSPPSLEELCLVGRLEKVPHWFKTLNNLTYLRLQHSRLREDEDVVSHVQALPNLSYLRLWNAYQGERLCFVEGFNKLKSLWIMECPDLKEIVMEEGAMPALRELKIKGCKELRRLPDGATRLRHLREVRLYEVSDEIVYSICGKDNNGTAQRPTTPHISYYRTQTHGDDEAQDQAQVETQTPLTWAYRILN